MGKTQGASGGGLVKLFTPVGGGRNGDMIRRILVDTGFEVEVVEEGGLSTPRVEHGDETYAGPDQVGGFIETETVRYLHEQTEAALGWIEEAVAESNDRGLELAQAAYSGRTASLRVRRVPISDYHARCRELLGQAREKGMHPRELE